MGHVLTGASHEGREHNLTVVLTTRKRHEELKDGGGRLGVTWT